MKTTLLLLAILTLNSPASNSQAIHPFNSCPNTSVAIVRAGFNQDINNPNYLYLVNSATGTMNLVANGPYLDPADPSKNLQVNGIGLSRKDGYIYGMSFDTVTKLSRFLRLDSTYGVTALGIIPAPSVLPGQLSFVNPAAGDMDSSGNYYFSAFTINNTPIPTFARFYLGKIANTQTIVTGPPTVEYFEVNVTGVNCVNFITSIITDPVNSGLKDLSFHAGSGLFLSYATYKLPAATNYSGQLVSLVPIPGSSPLAYQLICNPVVNTHSAETSGTLIDNAGRFGVLFTDGSYGLMNTIGSGAYNGGITIINSSTGLPNPLRGDMGSCGLGAGFTPTPLPFICPGTYAAARAGLNADIHNPYSIYSVNETTGAMTLLPNGPIYYPGSVVPVQFNGFGVNKTDGFMYGMAFEGSFQTARLVRVDANYNVVLRENIPPPVPTAPNAVSFVNSAAGEVDHLDNYYFTAATAVPGSTPGSFVLHKLFLGKIEDVSTVTGAITPIYYEVEWQGNQCTDFISSLNNDPVNSGVKDLFYHPVTRTLFTYATYKLPGDVQYRGQMLELKPVGNPDAPNRYKLFCKNVINNHTGETSGTSLASDGKFLILMTDGSVGHIPRTGNSFNYSGNYVVMNNATGLPNPLRGDLGSCNNFQHPSGNPNAGRNTIVFALQPNPVLGSQSLELRWTAVATPTPVNVTIYDAFGTAVRTISNVMAVTNDILTINVSTLTSGTYYVKVMSNNGQINYTAMFLKL